MQFEILAPAGSMESLIAGVRCGAHAVYLGGQTFNARRGAGNFSPQELQAAVQYCHTRGVKVYMTLNTLVSDSELPGAVAAAGNALDAGVDALSCKIWDWLPRWQLCIRVCICTPPPSAALPRLPGFKRWRKWAFAERSSPER